MLSLERIAAWQQADTVTKAQRGADVAVCHFNGSGAVRAHQKHTAGQAAACTCAHLRAVSEGLWDDLQRAQQAQQAQQTVLRLGECHSLNEAFTSVVLDRAHCGVQRNERHSTGQNVQRLNPPA